MPLSSNWIKIKEDIRKRHPLYPLRRWSFGFIAALGVSILVSGLVMMLVAHANSHMAAIRIALTLDLYLQMTQIAVAGLAIRNVLTARPIRLLILIGLGVASLTAILACLFMAVALDQTSLVEDFLDRIGSEPFFVLDMLVDPLHPIVDLLSSYYLRSVETEHMTRELFDILGASVSSGLFVTLPLCLLAAYSRHLRVRCESEVHKSDETLDPLKRLTGRFLRHWQRFRLSKPQPKTTPAKIPFITPLPPLPPLIPTRFDRDSLKLPSPAKPTARHAWLCLPKRGSLLARLWPFSASKR